MNSKDNRGSFGGNNDGDYDNILQIPSNEDIMKNFNEDIAQRLFYKPTGKNQNNRGRTIAQVNFLHHFKKSI